MVKFLFVLPFLLTNSFLLAGEAKLDTPKDKSPWKIEATPTVTAVRPGQDLTIKVRIVNTSDQTQTAYVRSIAWYAESDNAQVAFLKWPKKAGRGPVVTWHGVEVAPHEGYSHDWSCTVAGEAPAGELTFRIGVSVASGKHGAESEQVFWSEPVKLTVK